VRAWARANGHEVGDRGRLPVEITDAYRRAHEAVGQA
jgi:DNA polymerase-3 subunit epsilon